jgi:histidyl-tRNA synthetase
MKPSIPQGTRDFSATTIRKRDIILGTIKKVFTLYGYVALETPSMENLSTLTGKYGEEGDRLIFKILNNGLYEVSKHEKANEGFANVLKGKSDAAVTERALRYDLTIPFARYVAMNRNEIALPFKRYQMQPVWRADRPQKGRYREFWQCDADVVGSKSLILEAELLVIYNEVFKTLNIPGISIKVNNRKILAALAESIGKLEELTSITIAIDKLDKIGIEKVKEELAGKGMDADSINKIESYLHIDGDNISKLAAITSLLGHTENGKKGIAEIEETLSYLLKVDSDCVIDLDFTLARGLDYYTGLIVEVSTNAVKIGSIGGGGRYDNLTGVFDFPDVSGVGISFGVDRIYDVMDELALFADLPTTSTKVFFLNMGGDMEASCIRYVQALRGMNFAAEMYPEAAKFDKQMKYANKKGYPFIAIVGETELKAGVIALKNFVTGEQNSLTFPEVLEILDKEI